MIRKAIIPAGGKGTRLSPLSRFHPKELLPIGGKPAIQRVIEEASAAGITEIGVVTSASKPALRRYFSAESLGSSARNGFEQSLLDLLNRVTITFIDQPQPLGLGDAISCAAGFVGEAAFALMLPDNLFSGEVPLIGEMTQAHQVFGGSVIAAKVLISSANVPVNEAPMAYEPQTPSVCRILQIGDKGGAAFPAHAAPWGDLRGIGRSVLTSGFFGAVERFRATRPAGEIDDVGPLKLLLQTEAAFGYLVNARHFDVGDFPGYIYAQNHFVPVDSENQ